MDGITQCKKVISFIKHVSKISTDPPVVKVKLETDPSVNQAITHLNVPVSLLPNGPIFQVCADSGCGTPIVSALALKNAINVTRRP